MDERPSKRPCLQATCSETSEFPFTQVEDGSDFYDTSLPTNTPARTEEPRILTDAAPPSTPITTASIPGLGMLADSAPTRMLAQEDRLEAPSGARDEAADTVETKVGDAAGSIPATPVVEHVELSEPMQKESDSHLPPSRTQADDLNTRNEVGANDTTISGFPRIQDTGVNDEVTKDTAQDHLPETRHTQTHGESFGTSLEPFNNPCGVQSCNIQYGDSEMADIGDELAARESTITPKASEGESAPSATMFPTLGYTNEHKILPDLPPIVESTDGLPILPNLILNSENPEWEVDSSPYQSSSSSLSSDSSSDSSSEDDEYQLLTPSEQVRILMQEERGSDDEDQGDSLKVKDPVSGPPRVRTANEKPDTIIPIPDITLSQESKITPLGVVEGEVESTLLVRASVAGDYQVLESGSVLCLSDRSIIGVVSETLGRVQQPLYTVRFSNTEAICERGVAENGTEIFYVDAHSTFVFTQALKAIKGSDASNIHDEEVGDHEIEFSDDEKEAEYKRQLKLKKRDRRGGDEGLARPPHGGFRQNGQGYPDRGMEVNYDDGGSMISYEDEAGSTTNGGDLYDEGYTPLARPSNLHEMMGNREPPQESWAPNGNQTSSIQVYADTGRGRGHPRGGMKGRRGRDRQQRGRGRERRGFDNRRNTNHHVDQRPSYAHDPTCRSSNIPHHSSPHSGQHSYEPTQAELSLTTAVPSLPSPNSSCQTPAHMFHPCQLSSTQPRPIPVTAWPLSQSPQIPPLQEQNRAHIYSQSQTQPYPSTGSALALYPLGSHVNPAFFAGFQQQRRQGYEPYTQSAQPSYSPSSRAEGYGQQDEQARGNSKEMGTGSIGGAAGGFGGTIPDILRRLGSGSSP